MQPNLKSWEVTIEGIGPRQFVDLFQAPSPGLAKLAAQDRFGTWIKVVEVKEVGEKKLKLPRTVPEKRRRIRKTLSSRQRNV